MFQYISDIKKALRIDPFWLIICICMFHRLLDWITLIVIELSSGALVESFMIFIIFLICLTSNRGFLMIAVKILMGSISKNWLSISRQGQ